MQYLKELIFAMLFLLPALGALRAICCVTQISSDDEQAGQYKRRLKNLVIFIAIAEGIVGFLYMILDYLTMGGTTF